MLSVLLLKWESGVSVLFSIKLPKCFGLFEVLVFLHWSKQNQPALCSPLNCIWSDILISEEFKFILKRWLCWVKGVNEFTISKIGRLYVLPF